MILKKKWHRKQYENIAVPKGGKDNEADTKGSFYIPTHPSCALSFEHVVQRSTTHEVDSSSMGL
jgi:hypothetical protein